MSRELVAIPAGKLFCISSGEYSDYSYKGHFLALEEITPEWLKEVADGLRAEEEAKADAGEYAYGYARDQFLPRLIKSGKVMDIDCTEIHIGAYGELDV